MNKNNSLLLEYEYTANPETVFDAWIKPDIAKQWLFKSDSNEILDITMDVREGGRFSILELNDGTEINHCGTYLEIERPGKLVFTLEVPKHFPGVGRVEINIINQDKNSKLIFKESEIDTTKVEKNWREMLSKLEEVLKK
jgi:uncharacterized protein YndB with AHSA1/START domain